MNHYYKALKSQGQNRNALSSLMPNRGPRIKTEMLDCGMMQVMNINVILIEINQTIQDRDLLISSGMFVMQCVPRYS